MKATPQIRASTRTDRDTIVRFTHATSFFRDDEMQIAIEVLDEALAKGQAGHYQSYTAESGGIPVGWICYGPTPCTLGTFDIYWIVVAPEAQNQGIGSLLLTHAEQRIAAGGGRLSIIETSGRPIYDATCHFYLRRGYREAARLDEFYAPGDDKIIYIKRLTA
jgi:GNAT superfamily N-acetyltransferase